MMTDGHHHLLRPDPVQHRGANRGVQGWKVLEDQLIGVSWGRNGLARANMPPWPARASTNCKQPDQMPFNGEGNTQREKDFVNKVCKASYYIECKHVLYTASTKTFLG